MKKTLAVLVGRFQVPEPHEGHRFLIKRICEDFDQVLILVGSVNRAISIKNPYSYEYRKEQLLKLAPTVAIKPLNDYKYSDTQWQADVIATVNDYLKYALKSYEVYLCGHWKEGNDYLKWFPQWKKYNVESSIDISGTEIRNAHRSKLPKNVQEDMAYYEKEAALFSRYPYPETLNFNCADAVLECNGHVLLIQRKFAPGAGTWALPGGFKNRNETFIDCGIRELIEETNIRIPEKVLRGSISGTRLFDAPNRSYGIPRNTMAVHMVVKPDPSGDLPRANGCDDANETRWVSIHDILNNFTLYDDHGDIISIMTGSTAIPAFMNPRF